MAHECMLQDGCNWIVKIGYNKGGEWVVCELCVKCLLFFFIYFLTATDPDEPRGNRIIPWIELR